MTKDNFIERANKVHVGSYDYSQLDDEFDVNSKGESISQVQAINLNMRRGSSIDERVINCLAIRIFGRRA